MTVKCTGRQTERSKQKEPVLVSWHVTSDNPRLHQIFNSSSQNVQSNVLSDTLICTGHLLLASMFLSCGFGRFDPVSKPRHAGGIKAAEEIEYMSR